MSETNSVWNDIFARDGRIFNQPNEDIPAFCTLLRAQNARKVLDLGCGSGRHVVYLASAGFDVCGLDQAPYALDLASQWLQEAGLQADLRPGDMLEPLPFADETFDGILSIAVIHHTVLAKIRGIIAEMERVLKPGGLIFVTVARKYREPDDVPSEEIEPDTYVPLGGSEQGLPHHLFTEETLRDVFSSFTILETHVSNKKHHVCITAKKSA